MISVNVEEGFFIHWCEEFLSEYGNRSKFPKAVSDLYTLKLAKIMDRNGDLAEETTLALFSNEKAVGSLKLLIKECDAVGKLLYKEAFGTEKVGVVREVFDEKFGTGTFDRWLIFFEDKNYQSCKKIFEKLH